MLRITKYLAGREKAGLTTTLRIAVKGLHSNSATVKEMIGEAISAGELRLAQWPELGSHDPIVLDYLAPEIATELGYNQAVSIEPVAPILFWGVDAETLTPEEVNQFITNVFTEEPVTDANVEATLDTLITEYKGVSREEEDSVEAILDAYKELREERSAIKVEEGLEGLKGLVGFMNDAVDNLVTSLSKIGESAAYKAVVELGKLAPPPPKCKLCGKVVSSRGSLVRGMGPNCLRKLGTYYKASYNDLLDPDKIGNELLAEMVKNYPDPERTVYATKEEALAAHPEGVVKVSTLKRLTKLKGVPMNRLIKAIGGDKGEGTPLNPDWEAFKIGGVRYVSANVNLEDLGAPRSIKRESK